LAKRKYKKNTYYVTLVSINFISLSCKRRIVGKFHFFNIKCVAKELVILSFLKPIFNEFI